MRNSFMSNVKAHLFIEKYGKTAYDDKVTIFLLYFNDSGHS